jgi:hypothetical protein
VYTEREPMKNNDQIDQVYTTLLDKIDLLLEDHDPLMIAAVMMAQSMAIYRTALSEDDYNTMMTSILSKRSEIEPFKPRGTLH